MEKRLFKSACINVENMSTRLDYYIICDDCGSGEMAFGVLTYGVEVQKVVANRIQSVTVYDICCSEEKIKQLAELLCENTVMPVSVCDVVTDLLEDNFFDADESGSSVIAS